MPTSMPDSGPSESIDAARRPSPDTRPDMLRLLVHEFLKQPIRNEAAESRFVTLAIRLIEAVDVPVAAKHVRELAPHPAVPRALALYLATAPLSLAGPFLRLSPVLTEDDLIDLARQAAPSHLAAIAARRDVSPGLAKRIAELVHRRQETGDSTDFPHERATDSGEEVTAPADDIGTAPEPEAEFPAEAAPLEAPAPEAPAPAIAVIEPPPAVQEDEPALPETPVLGTPAAALPEVTTAEASVPADEPLVGERLAAEPPAAPTVAQEEVPSPPTDAEPSAAAATPAVLPSAAFFTAGPEERAALIARLVTLPPLPLAERSAAPPPGFIDALLDAARTAASGELATLLERTLGVTGESATRIVADETGQSMAVAARALGLSFAILSRVLFRLHPVAGRSTGDMARLAEMFDSLPLASAQHLVASWRGSRRPGRERGEDAPSMRGFAQPHPAAQAGAKTAEAQPRNGSSVES